MGLRGIGARKPIADQKPKRRPTWKKRGLSRAERVIAFIESLKLTAGRFAGRRFHLREWQKDFIRKIYRTKAGRRLVRTALITMGRKNGKTQLAAALALCHLVGPEAEARGEVYSAASDRNQAGRIFRELEAFILADSDLRVRCNIQRFNKKIEVLSGDGAGSTYEALSSDARKAHSLSPSFVVCDELAQWPDRELYDALNTGGGTRKSPLTVVISTMSSNPHHVLNELVNYGQNIIDGKIEDPSFAAFIFTTPDDADIWDEVNWYAANPALGDFRSLEEMREYAEKAHRIPARESVFRNLYLNQKVEADKRFIAGADWDDCAGEVDPEGLRGRPCYGGLDLSSTTDLTALVLYFPEDNGAVLPYFWAPADRLDEREHTDHVPYRTWHKAGLLEAPEGRAINKLAIIHRLAEITSMFDVRGLAFDRWRLEDLQKLLSDEGIELALVAFGQGFKSMAPAVDALETAILDRRLLQPEHPILTWNVGNAVVETDPAGGRKVSKAKSVERVDGLVALVMAVGLSAITAPVEKKSVYETRGILTL
jgi:phage terminase large subunit-like protein